MVMNNEWVTIATHFLGLTNEVSCHCKKSAELAIIANKSEAGAGQNGSQHLNKDNFLSQKLFKPKKVANERPYEMVNSYNGSFPSYRTSGRIRNAGAPSNGTRRARQRGRSCAPAITGD
jgi:hypothetical protein